MKRILVASVILAVFLSGLAPAARVKERRRIGRSVDGVALRAVNIGARDEKTRVLIVGCIHGNECAGIPILRKLRRMPSPKNYELWMIESLNPDGQAAGTRQNGRGVDLNRNFPAGWEPHGEPWDTYHSGSEPRSEPETRAAMRFIKRHRPDITIWYHQAMALVTKKSRHNRIPRRYARIARLPLRRLELLPGTASRWANKRFPRHSSFCVELPGGSLSSRSIRKHARAVRTVARAW